MLSKIKRRIKTYICYAIGYFITDEGAKHIINNVIQPGVFITGKDNKYTLHFYSYGTKGEYEFDLAGSRKPTSSIININVELK